ncbi:amidohydrolase family protein [Acidovorax sp. MR-S7]|uniref:metal-dependent hydrolase family protein n=1 Tax=Acidovorax sp. MR-S7 TaxID=1268622 RepID=UPI000375AEFF|nr:amidohydrolase family protein [Acidovorax sp. MR-S7]GAD22268.1 imidazolonepropionase and related amidohydrolases [Acidovorax sp. MR-S7]
MTPLFIANGNVLDVHTLTMHAGHSVLVEGGRIAAIGAGLQAPEGAEVVDAAGLTVMPGMIDCHVHTVASSFNLGNVARLPNVLTMLRALPIMQAMLGRGFTSVRDAGGADWSLAEAVRTGLISGPRIFPSGKALSQTGGHADFRPRSDELDLCSCVHKLGNIGRVVDGVDACRIAVREEILKGATQIKVMASGGVASPNDPIGNLGYSEDELRAIVEEAGNANTYVMAHAYTPRAISRAVRCGVRTIEHGNLVDRETAELMAAMGAYMVPTMITYEGLANEGEKYGLPALSIAKIEGVRGPGRQALEILANAGVKMGLGSDLLGETHYLQAEELRLRAEVLGNGPVLQQATLIGAEILGHKGELGEVTQGAIADLLLVDGNPLHDIQCLLDQGAQIRAIVKDGRIAKNTL